MREVIRAAVVCLAWAATSFAAAEPAEQARRILDVTGVRGGLVVHIGCGDGQLTAALRAGESFAVCGLDAAAANVAAARTRIQALGTYGPVTIDRLCPPALPFVDNLVNLVVCDDSSSIPTSEVIRVLVPNGVAYIKHGGEWVKTVKSRPSDIDEWSHYLHDSTNNAVAHDTVVGPPRHLQWVGSPQWARHHDNLASMSALVSAGGRVFCIVDEGLAASLATPSHWSLVARDAFNGTVLWKRAIDEWQTRFWQLKSGPAQLPRRLVASADTVFVTLGIDVPVTALDAATGEVRRVFEDTRAAEELLVSDGLLLAVVDPTPDLEKYRERSKVNAPWWTGKTVRVVASQVADGALAWQHEASVVPLTLTADQSRIFFHDGERVVCLNRTDGKPRWQSDPVVVAKPLMSFFAPTLLVQDGIVLFAGGEESGKVKSSGGAVKPDTLTALDADTGRVLWTGEHPPSGYSSPEDLFVIGGMVWCGGVSSGGFPGTFIGRDLRTGEEKSRFDADVKNYWFHHRCHRGKATDRYFMVSRTGIEFIDPVAKHWQIHDWVRGGCMYGIMPANGLIYTPPHSCVCYSESKLSGFNALAAASAGRAVPAVIPDEDRLEKGPAWGSVQGAGFGVQGPNGDWPTYRGDTARRGQTPTAVQGDLKPTWQAQLGGKLTAPVIAAGKVFVAQVDRHTLHALDANTGESAWTFTAGGRIDSPPTIVSSKAQTERTEARPTELRTPKPDPSLCIFGCADGWVYCLRAADGERVWRFRAAPVDRRLMAYEQLESVWPVSGSVLVCAPAAGPAEAAVYYVAGRSMFLDGGLRLLKLDPATGRKLAEVVLDDRDPETGDDLQSDVKWLNMPVALPDVLSTDGALIYMRSQQFDFQGQRRRLAPCSADRFEVAADQQGEGRHLFSPTGFLDGAWWHRSYWLYGRTFTSGWNGYYLSGKVVPGGRILAVGDTTVYGFGRKPNYYRWTTPLEYHLFAAPTEPPVVDTETTKGTGPHVKVRNSKSLDPANRPLTVEAWVNAAKPFSGVILARGGPVQGYSLYLQNGRPRFAIRAESELYEAVGSKPVAAKWTHLAGVLTAEGQLRVLVNGEVVGTTDGVPLIPKTPTQPMEIGVDDGGSVAEYLPPFGLSGVIDEVRVYHRALSVEEIRAHSANPEAAPKQEPELVLCLSFDDGAAADASGAGNHGVLAGAKPVNGKLGGGLRCQAKSGDGEFLVKHTWTVDVPLLVRAMVLTGRTAEEKRLFIAGPPDLLNEDDAVRRAAEPEFQVQLTAYENAIEGKAGGALWAVGAADGAKLAEWPLVSPPVWDGMAAANGRLYLCTMDGKVTCMAAE
ncbi:MAG: hypothetical protein A3K19_33970 [Lentisphaerae bacterium RIFOXYB12_FULL_65_16]|nr:MAG: hypothetical protein A3K19_23760 [Lentisphaerae bacterium RIFOXYB12_FULL_65_16]OGV95339.1 MAG: hypothetical protein A3K19_33970 [Lentisphaerae bacterium RIFOXYB12_FULL_65_16]